LYFLSLLAKLNIVIMLEVKDEHYAAGRIWINEVSVRSTDDRFHSQERISLLITVSRLAVELSQTSGHWMSRVKHP
jgi:hypothetical protein